MPIVASAAEAAMNLNTRLDLLIYIANVTGWSLDWLEEKTRQRDIHSLSRLAGRVSVRFRYRKSSVTP